MAALAIWTSNGTVSGQNELLRRVRVPACPALSMSSRPRGAELVLVKIVPAPPGALALPEPPAADMEPEKLLVTAYFSSLSGSEDKPENYNTVTYRLAEADGRTTLTIVQDNNPSQEAADHSAANWAVVLEALKILVEK